MPLYKLLQQRVFDPELISVMAEAYERTRLTLGLADRSDKLTHLLAEKIILEAESGVRDSTELYRRTLAHFRDQDGTPTGVRQLAQQALAG
jgi:hypothetical protein